MFKERLLLGYVKKGKIINRCRNLFTPKTIPNALYKEKKTKANEMCGFDRKKAPVYVPPD